MFQFIKYCYYQFFRHSVSLGIFFLTSFALVGNFNLGIASKSYDSFEMNQAVLTGGDIDLARQETRRLFGTQEENQGSILRAILRNPSAFILRMLANAKTLPDTYFVFFAKKLGAVLLIFAAWGVYALGRKKAFIPLAILLIWPIHALVSLGFLSLHIVPQVNYLPLLLGAIGISCDIWSRVPPTGAICFLDHLCAHFATQLDHKETCFLFWIFYCWQSFFYCIGWSNLVGN